GLHASGRVGDAARQSPNPGRASSALSGEIQGSTVNGSELRLSLDPPREKVQNSGRAERSSRSSSELDRGSNSMSVSETDPRARAPIQNDAERSFGGGMRESLCCQRLRTDEHAAPSVRVVGCTNQACAAANNLLLCGF